MTTDNDIAKDNARCWSKHTVMRKIIALTIILLAFLITISGKSAGQFLVIDEQPEKADVIIILSGEENPRMEFGCDLFNEGYAPFMILSGGLLNRKTTYAEEMMLLALKNGIPGEAIILEQQAESTYENAIYTKEIMIQRGFKSAIVTSSDYHMRRVKFLYDRVYRGTGITLIYCAAESSFFDRQKWWANKESSMRTFHEYCKLVGNALGFEGRKYKERLRWVDNKLFN